MSCGRMYTNINGLIKVISTSSRDKWKLKEKLSLLISLCVVISELAGGTEKDSNIAEALIFFPYCLF